MLNSSICKKITHTVSYNRLCPATVRVEGEAKMTNQRVTNLSLHANGAPADSLCGDCALGNSLASKAALEGSLQYVKKTLKMRRRR